MKKENLVFGVGINDYQAKLKENGKFLKFYTVWKSMLQRCYYEKTRGEQPTYQGCQVCEEWKRLSNFKDWFDEHYVEGWHLDKDLLVKGNKEYSPETCVFLPQEINSFLTYKKKTRGDIPIGVDFHKIHKGYRVRIRYKNKEIFLGWSKDPGELSPLYKKEKEREAKELAEEYKDKLDPRAYEALINFKID